MIPRGDDEPALSQHTQMVGHQILLDRYFLHQVGDGQGGFPERPDDRQSYGMGNKVETRGAVSGRPDAPLRTRLSFFHINQI